MQLSDTVNRYFEAIRQKDRAGWLDCFSSHPDLQHVDPVGAPARHSRDEIGAFWDQIHSLFATVRLDAEDIYTGGPDRLALTWVGRGKGHNGVEVEFRGIDVFSGDAEGKILRLEAYWDAAATLARLA